ncbi:MAG: glutathione S-transferase family protein [Myxococcota bacterium]
MKRSTREASRTDVRSFLREAERAISDLGERPTEIHIQLVGTDKLITAKGGGGLIVEAAYAIAEAPLEIEDISWDDVGPGSKRLAKLNSLGQVPTLVLADGSIMTESAAIVLRLADLLPDGRLAPPALHAQRAQFLRWLAFLVAALYPTFTYGDSPARWVGDEAGPKLRASTDAHREKLLRFLDAEVAGAPWFLGKRFSALDLYFPVLRMWRPGKDWWRANAPKLNAIADRCEALPPVKRAFARNRA